MKKRLYPYIIFLPKGSKYDVLRAVFGSSVPVDILNFALRRGVSEKIYQRDLIESLGYSNKTIIEHLKALVDLGVLSEHMEKNEVSGRAVWLKAYTLTDLGRWLALLLVEEENLSIKDKVEIACNVFRSYVRWIRELADKLGIDRGRLLEIFREEIGS
ncbi:MAG: ArsR family transcriptional regulator [Candidatus Bathyarchaeota archaeon]|nr:ArsR family transcriptional regulator [Candidatus Bathyarchaeota archaeon]